MKLWSSIKWFVGQVDKWAPLLLAAWILYQWTPFVLKHYGMEGQTISSGSVNLVSETQRPVVLIFWATWCTPCTLELKRIQRMVNNGSIPKDSVLAITSETDLQKVQQTVKDRGYTFQIVHDQNRELSNQFKVEVTPTLIVLTEGNKMDWVSSGISPTLEWRLSQYFSKPSEQALEP